MSNCGHIPDEILCKPIAIRMDGYVCTQGHRYRVKTHVCRVWPLYAN